MLDGWARYTGPDGLTRISVAVLTGVVDEARRRHACSPIATVAMGRVMCAGTLLMSTLRPEGRVNLQVVGNGPLGSITVDAAVGTLRASVRRPQVVIPIGTAAHVRVAAGVGHSGLLHVLVDPHGTEFVRGTSELVTGEIDDDVTEYFRTSAQLGTAFGTDVRVHRDDDGVAFAAGVLVQSMPGGARAFIEDTGERLRDGGLSRALGADPPAAVADVAARAFPGLALTLAEEHAVAWHCPCSRERVADALVAIGRAEVQSMLDELGQAEVTCEFCRSQYVFDADNLRALLANFTSGPDVAS